MASATSPKDTITARYEARTREVIAGNAAWAAVVAASGTAADIAARIVPGVRFTLDAHPGRVFTVARRNRWGLCFFDGGYLPAAIIVAQGKVLA